MNREKMQDALGEIRDEYILEAARLPSPAGRIFRRATAALAAAAAVFVLLFGLPIGGKDEIITTPGVLVVKAESATEAGVVVLQAVDADDPQTCVHNVIDQFSQNFDGVRFHFSMPEEFINARIDFTVDAGVILQTMIEIDHTDAGIIVKDKFTQIRPSGVTNTWNVIGALDGLYWFQWINLDAYAPAFMEIVLREDDHIVGYAVIKISPIEDLGSELGYVSQLLCSVSFPKVDGQYQNVTEEYVAKQISKVKSDTTSQYPTYIDPTAAHEIDLLKERTALRSQSHLLQEDTTIFRETVQEIQDALADEANRIPDTSVWIVRHLSHISTSWKIGEFIPNERLQFVEKDS